MEVKMKDFVTIIQNFHGCECKKENHTKNSICITETRNMKKRFEFVKNSKNITNIAPPYLFIHIQTVIIYDCCLIGFITLTEII